METKDWVEMIAYIFVTCIVPFAIAWLKAKTVLIKDETLRNKADDAVAHVEQIAVATEKSLKEKVAGNIKFKAAVAELEKAGITLPPDKEKTTIEAAVYRMTKT